MKVNYPTTTGIRTACLLAAALFATVGSHAAAAPLLAPATAGAAAVPDRVVTGDRLVLHGSLMPVAADATTAAAHPKRAVLVRDTLTTRELDSSLTFEVTLEMRALSALQERVAALPEGRVPAAELAANHLPAQADFDALEKWLTGEGFTIKKRDGNRLAIFASGSIRQVQDAFQTRFAQVAFAGGNHLAAVTAPSVPASLKSVLAVTGLQPFIRAHVNSQVPTRSLGPVTNYQNQAPYLVSEILHAFSADTTALTGAGQEIGIIINAVPPYDDLTSFWSYNNINHTGEVDTEDVNVSGQSDTTLGEATLDIEWSTGIAPGADETIFTTGSLAVADTDSAYSTIGSELKNGDHPGLHSLSLSYSLDEDAVPDSYLTSEQQYFATIASYGVTILVSSGDNGAFDKKGGFTAEYPTSDPSVTGVGGVSIVLNTSTGAVASEIAWSADAQGFSDGRIAASGGGVSRLPRPSWQKGTGVPSGSTRLVPDVAASSDQNEAGVVVMTDPNTGQQELLAGANGTSWAAPTWGGLVALLNEGRANAGLAAVGLLNPKIYPLIGTNSFRDITQGNNGHYGQNDAYSAGTGYDLVTGVGTPIFSNLLTALTASAPKLTSFSPTSGPVGTTVVIKGTGFVAPLSVVFTGNVSAAGSFSSTQITATVPSGAQTGPIKVTTSAGSASTSTFTVTTTAAKPAITSATSATAHVGTAFSYAITASGTPTSYGASGLPSGLSINQTTGKITGTPTKAGTYSVTIAAFNAAGHGSATLTLTVMAPAPVVTSSKTATATVGTAFSYTIAASNGPTSYGASGLPSGLSISQSTGKISGTPTKAGTYSVTIAAFNAAGHGSAILTLTVKSASTSPAPVITSAKTATATVGRAFSYQITASNSPTSYGAAYLPSGLSINTSTGKITGTPASSGRYAVTIAAFNAAGHGSATLTLTVN